MHSSILAHFVARMSSAQHGYIRVCPVVTDLVTFLDYTTARIGHRYHAGSVYFDSSKAFDLVNRSCHIYKLGIKAYQETPASGSTAT